MQQSPQIIKEPAAYKCILFLNKNEAETLLVLPIKRKLQEKFRAANAL